MLCATCISVFQTADLEGPHHRRLDYLGRAAAAGCKICRYLRSDLEQGNRNYRLVPESDERVACVTYELDWAGGRLVVRFHYQSERYLAGNTPPRHNHNGLPYVACYVSYRRDRPQSYTKYLQEAAQDLKREPWNVRRDDGLGLKDIPSNTGHPAVAQLAKTWLESCRNLHSRCEKVYPNRDPKWYPRRLLLTSDENGSIRLLDTAKTRLKGPYATLSHCWGKDPTFCKLTAANLEDYQKNLPLSLLPQSFLDAVTTCRRMGLEYLWIDSLCIIQEGPGSEDDWRLQSKEMNAVYLNCALNIAIDHAGNPHVGAFRTRSSDNLQQCSVLSRHLDRIMEGFRREEMERFRENDHRHLLQPIPTPTSIPQAVANGRIPVYYLYTKDDVYGWVMPYMPLVQRGWVFQERLLSPRILHFLPDRITWECEESPELSEYDQIGHPEVWSREIKHDPFNLQPEEFKSDIKDAWLSVVGSYSQKQLTYPDKDKLVALGAIAETFQSDGYAAGIFLSGMPLGLLWFVDRDAQHAPEETTSGYQVPHWNSLKVDWASYAMVWYAMSANQPGYRRRDRRVTADDAYTNPVASVSNEDVQERLTGHNVPAANSVDVFPTGNTKKSSVRPYRAPSWSWVSQDGPVSQGAFQCIPWATVEGVHVDLVDPNNVFGQVKSGCLRVTGMVLPWVFDTSSREQTQTFTPQDNQEQMFQHPKAPGSFEFKLDDPQSTIGETLDDEVVLLAVAFSSMGSPVPDDLRLTTFQVHGLVLCKAKNGKRQRIGYFKAFWSRGETSQVELRRLKGSKTLQNGYWSAIGGGGETWDCVYWKRETVTII